MAVSVGQVASQAGGLQSQLDAIDKQSEASAMAASMESARHSAMMAIISKISYQ